MPVQNHSKVIEQLPSNICDVLLQLRVPVGGVRTLTYNAYTEVKMHYVTYMYIVNSVIGYLGKIWKRLILHQTQSVT